MRQVLLQIPLDAVLHIGPFALPWFGFGILLACWIAFGIWVVLLRRRESKGPWRAEDTHPVIVWSVIALAITIAPHLQQRFGVTGIPIFGYGFMLFLGFITAVTLASRRAMQQGLSPDVVWDLAPWLLIPGILGARTFFCLQYPQDVFGAAQNASDYIGAFLNLSRGGLVLYGGLIGGAAGYFEYCRRARLNPLGLGDLITPSVFVGIGFGRIGCLLNGCCFGDICELPWAIHFPRDAVPFHALVEKGFLAPDALFTPGLHPTQIYSAIDGFLIAALTSAFFPYRRSNGEVFAIGLMTYATTRFLIEFLRGDEPGQLGTGLTISQIISLGMFLTGLVVILDRAWRPAFRQIATTVPG